MKKYIKFRLVDGYISSDESNESENIDGFFFCLRPNARRIPEQSHYHSHYLLNTVEHFTEATVDATAKLYNL